MLEDIDQIGMLFGEEISTEVKRIYKELPAGVDYEEVVSKEFGYVKDEMQEMFKEYGIDVDLSEINITDSHERDPPKATWIG